MIHYDKLANQIQFVGRRQGVRCVKQQTAQCPRATRINRMVSGRTVNDISRNFHNIRAFSCYYNFVDKRQCSTLF